MSLSEDYGKGTNVSPLNYSRISEISIDDYIFNDEADKKSALIYYNELQLREIDVIITIYSATCKEMQQSSIESELLSKIKSLEVYRLTI